MYCVPDRSSRILTIESSVRSYGLSVESDAELTTKTADPVSNRYSDVFITSQEIHHITTTWYKELKYHNLTLCEAVVYFKVRTASITRNLALHEQSRTPSIARLEGITILGLLQSCSFELCE